MPRILLNPIVKMDTEGVPTAGRQVTPLLFRIPMQMLFLVLLCLATEPWRRWRKTQRLVAEFPNFAHIAGAIMSDSKSFFEAIRAGDLSKVESLLQSDSSLVTARDASGASPVLVATYAGHSEICDLLLARGGQLEIHDAAAAGHLARVKELVAKKPALAKAFSPDGFPVVSLAAVFGHFDVARFLAEKGADISAVATNGTGYNALTGSVTSGHTEMVKWLLETGADPNYRYGPGYTPLLAAAANGRLEIVKLLLAHGADLCATSNDGKSALALATEHNHPAVAEFLKEASTARAG